MHEHLVVHELITRGEHHEVVDAGGDRFAGTLDLRQQDSAWAENGDHFDRIPVAVLARDSISVAIANDGQVWPGQSIAISGAHQLQMALKNKSGDAIDPHAGHNH